MRYTVEVKFHEDYIRVEEDRLVVGVKSKPEKGKANLELIKKLAKHFNVDTSRVKIVSGLTSRTKIIEVMGG
ncbi:MAG: DUF167 domain-containing protein [Candidatus Bathyarchaeia archaeon]